MKRTPVILSALPLLLCSGCASHLIQINPPDYTGIGGNPYEASQTSVAGDVPDARGCDPAVDGEDCKVQIVVVEKNTRVIVVERGENSPAPQTNFAGRSGFSTDAEKGVLVSECRSAGLGRVEVRRNFGQGLLSLLTLGIVNPSKIYYYCAKPPPPPEEDNDPDGF
ncbi:MAG: hypothetical protein AAFX04_00415 [Pseudomonadota bacterium]